MKIDIQSLYSDYNIHTAPTEHKHYREGWVQVRCPFCTGNEGYHLGFNIEHSYFNCWRCGHKSIEKALSRLLGISYQNTKQILRNYKKRGVSTRFTQKAIKIKKKAFKMPKNFNIFKHKYSLNYLMKRGFTKKQIKILVKDFDISTTGNFCFFKHDKKLINLKYRILAPIYWQGDIVSWQTRDSTEKKEVKYITCPKKVEKAHHKHILYAKKDFRLKDTEKAILVEGIFDVWKIHLAGYTALGGFGVELKTEQILLLKQIPELLIWLDPDKPGKKKGKEIFTRLTFAGCNVKQIAGAEEDPGDLTIKQIRRILK